MGGTSGVLYELDFVAKPDLARAATFVLHAALDMVDLAVWSSSSTFLKIVDRHNEQLVSAYVTPGGARFLVLHDARNEDGIRAFCTEAHEVRADARARLRVRPSRARALTLRSPPPTSRLPPALHEAATEPLLRPGDAHREPRL